MSAGVGAPLDTTTPLLAIPLKVMIIVGALLQALKDEDLRAWIQNLWTDRLSVGMSILYKI